MRICAKGISWMVGVMVPSLPQNEICQHGKKKR